MGVTLLQIFPEESKACYSHKATERLHSRIVNLGAVASGMFTVDCETYYTIAGGPGGGQQGKKLHIVHNSETPVTTNAVIDTGAKQLVLSADILFDLLIPKLNHMYQSKKNLKIESKGARYEIGDFIVKVGTVTMSNGQYKGILVEVEYLPCVVPDQCWGLLKEFMQSFMGSCVPSEAPKYITTRFHEIYTPQDTIQQYLEKFNEFREAPSTSAAVVIGRET